jgi:hypothetical protein
MTLAQELSGYVQRLHAAATRDEVGAVYLEMVGYDSAAEDEGATLEDLRSLALDYVREVCHANSVHVSTVGL